MDISVQFIIVAFYDKQRSHAGAHELLPCGTLILHLAFLTSYH